MLKIFTIYDSQLAAHAAPFFLSNRGVAIRELQDGLRDNPKSKLATHPGDFTMFEYGTFNEATGEFIIKPQERVMTLAEIVALGQQ